MLLVVIYTPVLGARGAPDAVGLAVHGADGPSIVGGEDREKVAVHSLEQKDHTVPNPCMSGCVV